MSDYDSYDSEDNWDDSEDMYGSSEDLDGESVDEDGDGADPVCLRSRSLPSCCLSPCVR